ncbi:unnamed protein product [Prunus armeniaca]
MGQSYYRVGLAKPYMDPGVKACGQKNKRASHLILAGSTCQRGTENSKNIGRPASGVCRVDQGQEGHTNSPMWAHMARGAHCRNHPCVFGAATAK